MCTAPAALAGEKIYEFRDDLVRRFFHEPVPRTTYDHAFNIFRHKPALLNQEITRSLFSGQNEHRHG